MPRLDTLPLPRLIPRTHGLIVVGLLFCAGCAKIPALDETVDPAALRADYPVILPLDQVLAETQGRPATPDAADGLEARTDALRARAAALRGRPLE